MCEIGWEGHSQPIGAQVTHDVNATGGSMTDCATAAAAGTCYVHCTLTSSLVLVASQFHELLGYTRSVG